MDAQLQTARQARKGIDLVRKQLLKPVPDALDACSLPLSEAIGCLEKLEGELRSAPGSWGPSAHLLRKEIYSLRGELSAVSALLKSAGAFYEGYGSLLGSGAEPEVHYGHRRRAAPEPDRRFIVHG